MKKRLQQRAPVIVAAVIACAFVVMAWLRFDSFHNRTFDLAFYARMAWGMARGDLWMPILDAHIFGLHLSPVLVPIGWLGMLVGTVNALLLAQGLSAVGAAWALARLGRRHLGAAGAWAGALALVLHPNLGFVLSYEAHPGTLALFPLAWAVERLDARDGRGVLFATLGLLACREDLALIGLVMAALLARHDRRHALFCATICAAWFGLFILYLHPVYAPEGGSFAQHLGMWGHSPASVLRRWFEHPGDLLAHVFGGRRGTYLIRVLAPLAFLPLLGLRLALPALPVLAMNLVSGFQTTPNLDSHYLTPAIPFLVAAALIGAERVQRPRLALGVLGLALCVSYGFAGLLGGEDFHDDDASAAAASIVALVPPDASVQAPDAMLAHFAERTRLHRAPPPNHGDEYTIVDISHRRRYARRPALLRTLEEPTVRNWLQRPDYGLVGHAYPYMVFAKNADPRDSEHLVDELPVWEWPKGVFLTSGLRWTDAHAEGDDVVLDFLVLGPCPADLALRFGDGRVDLLFDGTLGMSHLRRGDVVRSRHRDVSLDGLSIGLIRTSGAPPRHGDPRAVPLSQLRLQQRSVELRPAVPEEAPAGTLAP